MEFGEALGIAAQIAITLAGFAGVVVVFRRESIHEWSPADRLRLRLLLTNSILPLVFCMIGILLAAVINCELAVVVLAITFNKTITELDVAPGVVPLCLHSRRNNRIDSNN